MALFSLKSIDFDGSNDHAITSNGTVANFDHNEPFSISLWFKTTDVSGYLASKIDNALLRGYGLYIYTSGQLYLNLLNSGSAGINVTTTAGFNNGLWHHAVATYSGNGLASGVTFYIDGVSEAKDAPLTDNLAGATTVSTQPFQINCRSGALGPLTAQTDDVAIYDKELSAGEVTAIYNNGTPVDNTGLATNSNLVGYWLMGDGDTYPTLTDSSSSSNDATMTNMVSGDIVDSFPTGIVPGSEIVLNGTFGSAKEIGDLISGAGWSSTAGAPGGPVITYTNRGRDAGRTPGSDYIIWATTGSPDFAGAGYAGGSPTPIGALIPGSVVVTSQG